MLVSVMAAEQLTNSFSKRTRAGGGGKKTRGERELWWTSTSTLSRYQSNITQDFVRFIFISHIYTLFCGKGGEKKKSPKRDFLINIFYVSIFLWCLCVVLVKFSESWCYMKAVNVAYSFIYLNGRRRGKKIKDTEAIRDWIKTFSIDFKTCQRERTLWKIYSDFNK